ncbi:hypothetical protein G4L37_10305 [Serpentinimonas maccroryi]|nr:hypothetical protein [Serpentinimonas maccroryi]
MDGHTAFIFDKINFLMDAIIGFINISQSKVVKIFSVAAVAMLPPTLIASIYGMNFEYMPELSQKWGYLSEDEAISVLDRDRRLIAREIHAQMMAHFWEEATEYEVQVSRGFTELKPCNYTATAGQTAHHFRETVTETSRIKQMLFGGFARCLYPRQKFDSDTERRFAIILERDATKWLKPAKGQFQIYYKLGAEQPEYIPDFVAETDAIIFMVETKARADINTQEVQAKAAAAMRWCKHASDHAASVGTKPWKYLLVPHDEVSESKRLADYLRFEVKA